MEDSEVVSLVVSEDEGSLEVDCESFSGGLVVRLVVVVGLGKTELGDCRGEEGVDMVMVECCVARVVECGVG